MASDRLEMEHVIEGGDGLAVRGRQLESAGDLDERLRREPAVVLLGESERRQDRRPALGVLGGHLADLLGERHRSTSPITVSSEPTIAIMSAISDSRRSVAVACRATKLGARKRTRHGFAPPSEQR